MSAALDTRDDGGSLIVGLCGVRCRVQRPWGELPGSETIGMWTAVACDSKGRVYVYQRFDPTVDEGRKASILVYGSDGRYQGAWGESLVKDAHHLFIDRSDRVFLVDRDAHQIVVCTLTGECLFRLGLCDEPGRPFNHPTSVAVAPGGNIYVADGYGAAVVHRFSPDGKLLHTWGKLGQEPGTPRRRAASENKTAKSGA